MLVRDEGGGGRGLTTSRNKSAIGGRNLFVDGPLDSITASILTGLENSSSCALIDKIILFMQKYGPSSSRVYCVLALFWPNLPIV